MSVQTILLDFSIEPSRISDAESRKDLVKLLENGLTEHFPQLKLCYELTTADGCLVLFTENQSLFFHVRLFNHGIITINAEYFKLDTEQQLISFDVSTQQLTIKLKLPFSIQQIYPFELAQYIFSLVGFELFGCRVSIRKFENFTIISYENKTNYIFYEKITYELNAWTWMSFWFSYKFHINWTTTSRN